MGDADGAKGWRATEGDCVEDGMRNYNEMPRIRSSGGGVFSLERDGVAVGFFQGVACGRGLRLRLRATTRKMR
ncbi:hypothetical protein C4D60_Mb04t12470 [Musa balbisiana]|uniref:Uncharacterized protein n=1 Tax=Musa balbisiana TaxID=52838 RepID=A0A4S8KBH7_MUSBA|nr:hypothetical protein C4D60_Mb04t12470 [Musa balbisiana]